MVTIEQAKKILFKNMPRRKFANCPLTQSRGRVLAEDIIAREPSPRFTNSAMDGYAVHWADIVTAFQGIPIELPVVGESQAGIPYGTTVHVGEAIRISTGALMPKGCDTVVPIEEIEVKGSRIKILNVKAKNQHVRYKGEEFDTGAILVNKGKIIKPAHIALLAMQGIVRVKVYARPTVAIISTGSELKPFDCESLGPGEIRNSNSPMLQAAVEAAGGAVKEIFHVDDDPQATREAIHRAADVADLIITSGGVSVGPHDHVKEIAVAAGFTEVFWKVRQKPGKPMYAASKNDCLLIGLPGNPVSAFMCFTHYLKPLIEEMNGLSGKRVSYRMQSSVDIKNNLSRTELIRVRLSKEDGISLFAPLHLQGSHMPTTVAQADGYVVITPHRLVRKGESVEVFLF